MEIRVGPPNLTIHADEQFLVCAPDATISEEKQQGFFSTDTRLVSAFGISLARQRPVLLNSAVIAPFAARFEFVNEELSTRRGRVEAAHVHLRLDRVLHDGLHEDYDVTNYERAPVDFDLELRIEGDYADLFDVKEHRLVRRGTADSTWSREERALRTTYRNEDFERGLRLAVERCDSEPTFANGLLSFRIALAPKERWHTCLLWTPLEVERAGGRPLRRCHAVVEGDSDLAERRRRWTSRVTRIETSDPHVNAIIGRAVDDLAALRMGRHDEQAQAHGGEAADAMVPAAGMPWFVSLFGRDALVVSLQTLLLTPGLAVGSLQALGQLQGEDYDDRRDLQPGKIEHEFRHGELAHFRLIPQTPYYGTHDAPALYVWTAVETWHWTANRELLERLRPNVERALEWIDRDGDQDGDGLQEYRTRAGDWGYYNQSWKDSGDAIVHASGELAELPIATCELQGYVVAAKRGWAEVLEQAFEEPEAAAGLRAQAEQLASAIEERFWWEAEGTYLLGLDGRKRPIESVASNPGHLLWAQAVDPARAASTARRLLAGDLWSGWGVRTLSSAHAAYNPHSYQLGSVWPHDNAILANGLAHYGHTAEAAQVARALLDAARCFQHGRLPEVFAGLERDEGSFPAQYLGANVPQAWAAAAVPHLVAALVRPQASAVERRLTLSPALPDWLPEIALRNVRVGGASVDLRLCDGEVAVERRRGELEVARPDAAAPS